MAICIVSGDTPSAPATTCSTCAVHSSNTTTHAAPSTAASNIEFPTCAFAAAVSPLQHQTLPGVLIAATVAPNMATPDSRCAGTLAVSYWRWLLLGRCLAGSISQIPARRATEADMFVWLWWKPHPASACVMSGLDAVAKKFKPCINSCISCSGTVGLFDFHQSCCNLEHTSDEIVNTEDASATPANGSTPSLPTKAVSHALSRGSMSSVPRAGTARAAICPSIFGLNSNGPFEPAPFCPSARTGRNRTRLFGNEGRQLCLRGSTEVARLLFGVTCAVPPSMSAEQRTQQRQGLLMPFALFQVADQSDIICR